MHIPPKIHLLSTIQTGVVYYLAEEFETSTEPHFFVLLNKEPRTDECLLLVCASSQVEKRKQIRQKLGFPSETLVFISPTEFPLFTKDTVIDCNSVFEKNTHFLIERMEQDKLKICSEIMPNLIVEKLIQGVLASSQVTRRIKKMLSKA